MGSRASPDGLRIVLLLGNPFVADSRSWKMAKSLSDRGHTVTVVARWTRGLPKEEVVGVARVVRLAEPSFGRMGAPRLPGDEAASGSLAESGRSTGADRFGPGLATVRGRDRIRRWMAAATGQSIGRLVQAIRYLVLARMSAAQIARAIDAPDVWQAEGLVQLPIALELRRRRGGIVVYDSRDLDAQSARFARLPPFWSRLLRARERGWARSADAIITTNRPYADAIERSTGRRPAIVWNGPLVADPARTRAAHDAVGLAHDVRIVLALGQVAPDRGLEQLCEAIGLVPDVALVIVGSGSLEGRIRDLADALPWGARIRIHPAIAPSAIPSWTASADVAAMPIRGTTLNHRLTTPTRLFDALGAGVPVVASSLPGMAEIVRTTGCGVLCDPDDPAAIAAAIRTILESLPARRAEYRAACLSAASGPYAWERQVDVLTEEYDRALQGARDRQSGTFLA